MESVNEQRAISQLNLVAEIVRTNEAAKIYNVTRNVHTLAKLAKSLHKRYENMCNFSWANESKYERRTITLEGQAVILADEIGVKIEFQRDPRGWPLIIKAGPYETRLG